MRILIVDSTLNGVFEDSVENTLSNQSKIAEILASFEENLVFASSGEAALRALNDQEFALAIFNVPTAFELATQLKERYQVDQAIITPLLFIVEAGIDVEPLFEGFRVGSTDCLVKPIVPQSLQAKVAVSIELYRQRDLLKQANRSSNFQDFINRQASSSNLPHLEAADWFQVMLHSIGDAVLAVDIESRISFINPVAETLTGWSKADAIGQKLDNVFTIIHQYTRQPTLNPVNKVLAEGVVAELANHTVLTARDGREFPIDDSAAPIRDSAGNIIGAILVFRDVTNQKKVQQLQAQLAAIIRSSDDAIIGKNLDGVITSWNLGAEHMYGYTAEEVIGKPVSILIPPNIRNDVPQILERIKRGERVIHYETKRMAKDGRVLDVSLTVSPIHDEDGNVIGASKIARDITEHKRLQLVQTRLAAIVESSDDAIIGKNLDGVITNWNLGAERMYGYIPEETVGQPVSMLIPPGFPNDVPQILERIKRGERVIHYETKRMAKDGRVLDVSLTVSPIHDKNGNVIGASKIARDITERKQREHELARLLEREQQVRADMENALSIRDEFLSIAAHELRTPITSLRGFAQSLLRLYTRTGTVPADRLESALKNIDEQSEKLGRLVSQLLDISRIESGRLDITRVMTDLSVLVRGIVAQEQINTEKHKIALIAPPSLLIDIDPLRIEQVITNLIDNAIKYGPEDTITVSIEARDQLVRITVADRGNGIPLELRDKLFERFYQAHQKSSGMGLGLYISRQIVELHNGTLNAEFPINGGTMLCRRVTD